eukprot:TRINITY_DN1803_c0_g2_i1.p1 TRINITY_DN1803_c0_g2~~TRINITY_DN1803_c0_g2_i1.p1  ORF type:complete len:162 (-),score=57.98 TRINITY_DN1803_c0_g2_i1:154-639(-)
MERLVEKPTQSGLRILSVPLSVSFLALALGPLLADNQAHSKKVGNEEIVAYLKTKFANFSPKKASLLVALLYYFRNFVGIFITSANRKRKISDFVGFILYLLNVYLTTQLTKQEQAVVNCNKSEYDLKLAPMLYRVKSTRTLQIRIIICLMIQQIISWRNQ